MNSAPFSSKAEAGQHFSTMCAGVKTPCTQPSSPCRKTLDDSSLLPFKVVLTLAHVRNLELYGQFWVSCRLFVRFSSVSKRGLGSVVGGQTGGVLLSNIRVETPTSHHTHTHTHSLSVTVEVQTQLIENNSHVRHMLVGLLKAQKCCCK